MNRVDRLQDAGDTFLPVVGRSRSHSDINKKIALCGTQGNALIMSTTHQENSVLRLRLPKAEKAKPRQIAVVHG